MKEKPTLEELKEALRFSWCRETAYKKKEWTPKNPAHTQCWPTVYVVHKYFGGKIKVGIVKGEKHLWNQLPNGQEKDLTEDQFSGKTTLPRGKVVDPRRVFARPWIFRRCKILEEKVEDYLRLARIRKEKIE